MHKKHLIIKWIDDNEEQYLEKVLPIDILVKDKQEFLMAISQNNKELCIRLDKITLMDTC